MRARLLTAVAAVAALVLSGMPAAAAPPPAPPGAPTAGLPTGWRIAAGRDGPQLIWTAPRRVPMGDAAVEVWAGDRRIGVPRPAADQRTFTLDATGVRAAELAGLQVRAGGRRIDAGAPPAARTQAAPPPAAAALPVHPVDPGKPGRFATVTGEYDLPGVKLPGFPAKVEMRGVVVAPKGATGKRPLALFLHGRHLTCYTPGVPDGDAGGWPCAQGQRAIPSHRGYLQAQRLLASQGYVTVSISANGINGQDWAAEDGGAQARSSLVRLHLARWADWAAGGRAKAPAVVRAAPRADLGKVFLMGHSRGGEGVNRAAVDSLTPPPAAEDGYRGRVRWTIRGTLLIGPTLFGHNPAADVPSVTILPGCDGDVSDLQGQMYIDATRGVSRGAALHSAVYVVGANHNFFNTEWTPGQSAAPSVDDFWDVGEIDPVCSPGTRTRLTARQQQNVGATYIAAAARLFVADDDRVLPLLDGTGVRAASAGPARVLSHALGAARTPFVTPGPGTGTTGGARLCAQVARDEALACIDPDTRGWSPHFTPFAWYGPEPGRDAVALTWAAAGTPAAVRPARAVSLAGRRSLALRVVVPPNSTGTAFDVAVTDTRGRRAVLGRARVDGLPGTERTASYWGQEVRLPLTGARGVDLRSVAALELVPRTAKGALWLIDASGWRTGTPAPAADRLTRVDIGRLTVEEGDSGTRTFKVPVTLTGSRGGSFRLFTADPATGGMTNRLITLLPGQRSVRVAVTVAGNDRYGGDRAHEVAAKAVRGTAIGGYVGGVLVTEDDPMPTVTAAPVAARTAEGGTLTWRFTLSAPADGDLWGMALPLPPATGPELSTTDVDPVWFEENWGDGVTPERPLSASTLAVEAVIPRGETTVDVTVPTVKDAATEPDEQVRLQWYTWPLPWGDPVPGPEVTGTVTP